MPQLFLCLLSPLNLLLFLLPVNGKSAGLQQVFLYRNYSIAQFALIVENFQIYCTNSRGFLQLPANAATLCGPVYSNKKS